MLAHRGQHWTLLQNACCALWNCAHTALTRAISPSKSGQSFIEVETLRALACDPFYMAITCLMDMYVQIQAEADSKKVSTDFYITCLMDMYVQIQAEADSKKVSTDSYITCLMDMCVQIQAEADNKKASTDFYITYLMDMCRYRL